MYGWELDHKENSTEGLMLLNCGVQTVFLEKKTAGRTARRSNQSILKEISPEDSLEVLTLKLKLQYFDHLIQTGNSLEKTLMLGKTGGQEEKGATEDELVRWHHWLSGHEFEQTPGDSEGQGSVVCCRPWGHKDLDTSDRLNNSNTVSFTLNPRYCLGIPLFRTFRS